MSIQEYYQNTSFKDNRTTRKLLVLDVEFHAAQQANGKFSVDLFEPFVIDDHCDIYLDSFTTVNATASNTAHIANSAFILGINEFPINTNVASNLNVHTSHTVDSEGNSTRSNRSVDGHKYNKIYIPNVATNGDGTYSHKIKKYNYVATINPQTLTKITGEITNAGAPEDIQNPSNPVDYGVPWSSTSKKTESSASAANTADFRFTAEFIFISRN